MSRSKLTASDKLELIRLFKETSATITSLAEQFGVSISTVRRVLKTEIPADEYEEIVTQRVGDRQNKRVGRLPTRTVFSQPSGPAEMGRGEDYLPLADPSSHWTDSSANDTRSAIGDIPSADKTPDKTPIIKRRHRRRSSIKDLTPALSSPHGASNAASPQSASEIRDECESPDVGLSRELEYSEGHDEVGHDEAMDSSPPKLLQTVPPLTVLPIQDANLPQQCYLVIDRSAELITRPLKEFSELGQVPPGEDQLKTLPIFVNHKLASRFSRKNQRIIKVPDSQLLSKTYSQLTAKGIERVMFDGQVFSLLPVG